MDIKERDKKFIEDQLKMRKASMEFSSEAAKECKLYNVGDLMIPPSTLNLYGDRASAADTTTMVLAIVNGTETTEALQGLKIKFFYAGILFALDYPKCKDFVKLADGDNAAAKDYMDQALKRYKAELESN